MTILYRHPVEADLPGITTLFIASRGSLPFERENTEAEISAQTFREPDFEADGAWVCVDGDQIAGYSDAILDKARIAHGDKGSQARVEVLPRMRGQGIEQELLDRALGFMRDRGMESAQAWFYEGDVWRKGLVEGAGFKPVHNYYSMIRKGGAPLPPVQQLDGARIEHVMLRDASNEEISRWLSVVNESFSELFNFWPWTVERVANIRDSTEEILRLTFVYVHGELVAVSMCEDSVPFNRERGLNDGWIDIIGVRKLFRKRGLGRLLMLDGMHWLLERSLTVMHLGVDAENRKALGLYTSLGFEVLHENSMYSKKL